MTPTSANHDLTLRDPEQTTDHSTPNPQDVYAARLERLMSTHGVQVWQALMRENLERAKRRKETV